jgi:hypothetical protein
MSETMPDDTPEEPPEAPEEPNAAAEARLADLGIDLSPEEQREADAMVARLREQFGLDEEVEEEEAEPEPEPSEPEEEPEPAVEEVQPTAEEWISIDGRAVPVAEARSMLELRQYLATHPEKAEAVRRAVEGEPAPEAPKEPEPPEWMDLDDPSQRFMWEQFKTQDRQIRSLQEQQSQTAAESARARAINEVNVALDTFRQSHPELTESDVQEVRTHAVALNIIGGLSQTRTGTDAVLKALDIAYLDHPDFAAKAKGEPTAAEAKAQKNAQRKQKLAGLSGSSGSAARQPEAQPKPTTDREAKEQAAKWLSEQGIL